MDAGSETLVDFHTHSHHSDGVLSPAALVERARSRGVSTLSLTDHDTFAGLEEARAACIAAAIDFVPGVELSASWRGQTIHIVGLQVDEQQTGMHTHLSQVLARRRARLGEIGERLEKRARLPGRFAIDWVRKDEQGRSARGDADLVKNSLGYGADVLAVADARVAAVRDGIAESARVSAAPRRALEEKAGNFIALDLCDGRFALYEHLAPGSIRVAAGDRVRRGQVVASLGFTGDSTEPHLHFHVADAPSPLSGEGLPFELEEFRVPGNGPPQIHRRERPAPNAVVMHPGPMNREVEIASVVADDPQRSLIALQVETGVAVRMACLEMLVGGPA